MLVLLCRSEMHASHDLTIAAAVTVYGAVARPSVQSDHNPKGMFIMKYIC